MEILRDKVSGKYFGEFVTMMEASRRAKGIGMERQPIIKSYHGEGIEFVIALHINELVTINENSGTRVYRIQALDSPNKRLKLRLHNAATLGKKDESLPDGSSTIPALMALSLRIRKTNVLGKEIVDD